MSDAATSSNGSQFRVFVSSTCFDLIDLRAELEVYLKELGVIPVLSDRLHSEFDVAPNHHSIENCLINVRKCDTVLVVLSRRFGSDLSAYGYPGKTATELEYETARLHDIPTRVYVRDRLAADHSVWKEWSKQGRVGVPPLKWVSNGDTKLLDFIERHGAPAAGNWYWPFRDSVELKCRIAIDIKREAAAATLALLRKEGRLPIVRPIVEFRGTGGQAGPEQSSYKLRVGHFGGPPAFNVYLKASGTGVVVDHVGQWPVQIRDGMELQNSVGIHFPSRGQASILIQYQTYDGLQVEESHRIDGEWMRTDFLVSQRIVS